LFSLRFSVKPQTPRIALVAQARSTVDIQELIKMPAKVRVAAGFQSVNKKTNCSLLLMEAKMTLHGASMLEVDHLHQLLQVQVVTVMFPQEKSSIADKLHLLKIHANLLDAAGTHNPILSDSKILHGATTKKEPTHAQIQLGTLKIQDSLMISFQR